MNDKKSSANQKTSPVGRRSRAAIMEENTKLHADLIAANIQLDKYRHETNRLARAHMEDFCRRNGS